VTISSALDNNIGFLNRDSSGFLARSGCTILS
jgi:hypothetical protein